MIHDDLSNSERYEAIHPRFKKAFEFLKTADLFALPVGKTIIDGENIVATVSLVNGIKPEESKLEAHRKYIDIQMPVSATETMGWAPLKKMNKIAQEYEEEKDILFFEDTASNYVTVNPTEFVVFFPEDAHQPCIGNGEIKKVIVKVRL